MERRFRPTLHQATLLLCTVLLGALVYGEGWIWSLKAAALMIPVSLLIG